MQESQDARRVSMREAALILGVSKDTIRRRITEGTLRADKIGTGPRAPIRIKLSDVEAFARPIPTANCCGSGR